MDGKAQEAVIDAEKLGALGDAIMARGPYEAFELLSGEDDQTIALVLARENPAIAEDILWEFSPERRESILAAAPAAQRDQWKRNHAYPEDSIGKLMEPPLAVLRRVADETPAHDAIVGVHRLLDSVEPVIR